MQTKTFLFNKIIRDKRFEKMQKNAVHVVARKLENDEKTEQFKNKLKEECNEVVTAQTRTELLEELADLLEVMRSLATAMDFTIEDIEKTRIEKRKINGGFDQCIFIEKVTFDESNPSYAYLSSKPEIYPVVEPKY